MIEVVEEMLKEKASLEREYLELVHISDEMSLPAEIYEKMIVSNIAHSLAVIADALADRKPESQTEALPKAINGVNISDAVAWADKWLEENHVSETWHMVRTLRDATEWQTEQTEREGD